MVLLAPKRPYCKYTGHRRPSLAEPLGSARNKFGRHLELKVAKWGALIKTPGVKLE